MKWFNPLQGAPQPGFAIILVALDSAGFGSFRICGSMSLPMPYLVSPP